MTKYNDLTQEQKESITKELRELFEEREEVKLGCGYSSDDEEQDEYDGDDEE